MLVHPYINYNKESQFEASEYMLEKVRILQGKSLREIFNLPYTNHTNYFLKSNLILKLDDFNKFNISVSLFNYINNPTNPRDFISSRLSLNSSYHGYETRTYSNLYVIRFNRTASQSSFVYRSIKNWNMLPMNLKSTSTANLKIKPTNHFRSHYQSFFFF